jgi:hypothetical protein
MDGSSGNDIATVADAFLTTVQVRADAPAILGADLSAALSWSEYGVAARRGREARPPGKHSESAAAVMLHRVQLFPVDLGRLLVRSQPPPARLTQPAIACALAVAHLADQLGPDERHALGIDVGKPCVEG